MPGFVVAAIVNEPAEVLDRFVAWYSSQGADQIRLFFDNPDHPDLARIAALPLVQAIRCTEAYWQGLGLSADMRFTRRQNAALTDAYHQLANGWLLNVDADELMYFPGKTISAMLADVPNSVPTLRIATAEHVITPGHRQTFRLPLPRAAADGIYGADAYLFRRRFGLIGHADGKSFHRAGQAGIRLRQHWAEDKDGNEITGERLGAAQAAFLLHYFAPDFTLWRGKVEWRLQSHGFPEPIKERLRMIQQAPDPEAGYLDLYRLLHCLDAEQVSALHALGGLLELPVDFLGA